VHPDRGYGVVGFRCGPTGFAARGLCPTARGSPYSREGGRFGSQAGRVPCTPAASAPPGGAQFRFCADSAAMGTSAATATSVRPAAAWARSALGVVWCCCDWAAWPRVGGVLQTTLTRELNVCLPLPTTETWGCSPSRWRGHAVSPTRRHPRHRRWPRRYCIFSRTRRQETWDFGRWFLLTRPCCVPGRSLFWPANSLDDDYCSGVAALGAPGCRWARVFVSGASDQFADPPRVHPHHFGPTYGRPAGGRAGAFDHWDWVVAQEIVSCVRHRFPSPFSRYMGAGQTHGSRCTMRGPPPPPPPDVIAAAACVVLVGGAHGPGAALVASGCSRTAMRRTWSSSATSAPC